MNSKRETYANKEKLKMKTEKKRKPNQHFKL